MKTQTELPAVKIDIKSIKKMDNPIQHLHYLLMENVISQEKFFGLVDQLDN